MSTVPMISPDGKIGDVPSDRAAAAEKSGFQRGVSLWTPEGKNGVVPLSRAKDALASGMLASKPAPKEDAKSQPSHPGAVERFSTSVGTALGVPEGAMTHPSDVVTGPAKAVMHPSLLGQSLKEMGKGMMQSQADLAGRGLTEMKQPGVMPKVDAAAHLLESGIPMIGPLFAKGGDQLRSGDIAGGVGTMTGLLSMGMTHPEARAETARMAEIASKPAREAVASGARKYAGKVATDATGLIPNRETGINVPDRIVEATDKIVTLKKSVDLYDQKASAASGEVARLADEATKAGVKHTVTPQVHTALELLYKKSIQLRNMEVFGQTKWQGWANPKAVTDLTPADGLKIRQDLDSLINYETKGGKDTPVSKAAHQARNQIDQAYDKEIPGWKDANEKASALIQAKDALSKRADRAEHGLTVQGLFRLVPHKFSEVPSALAVGGATYEALGHAGVHGILNYIGSGVVVGVFRHLWDSLPSQTARITFAEALADRLVGERAPQGPDAYVQMTQQAAQQANPSIKTKGNLPPNQGQLPSGSGPGGPTNPNQPAGGGPTSQPQGGPPKSGLGPGAASVADPAFEDKILGGHADFMNQLVDRVSTRKNMNDPYFDKDRGVVPKGEKALELFKTDPHFRSLSISAREFIHNNTAIVEGSRASLGMEPLSQWTSLAVTNEGKPAHVVEPFDNIDGSKQEHEVLASDVKQIGPMYSRQVMPHPEAIAHAERLQAAIRESKPIDQPLYRGMEFKSADAFGNHNPVDTARFKKWASYKEGDSIELPLSSFSTDPLTAEEFGRAGESKANTITLHVIGEKNALHVAHHSAYSEYEAVSGGEFKVVKRTVIPKPGSGTHIELTVKQTGVF